MNRPDLRFCFALLVALCGACDSRPTSQTQPTTVTFGAQAALSTTAIDFGGAPCGGASPNDAELTISNAGTIPLGFTASIDSPDFTLASPQSGTVDPGKSTTLMVHAAGVGPSSNAGAVKSGALVLTTDDATQPTIQVPLKVTAVGAMLSLKAPADFGPISLGAGTKSVPLVLTNTGTEPVDVALGAPANAAFSLSYRGSPGPVTLAPGASVPGLTATLVAARALVVDTNAPITTSGGAVCSGASGAALPQGIQLRASLTCP